ncbi:Protein SET DOMAIN GROUP 41 [Platanthera guangdongensis]|uniref:Protein SET DOMAIN GROUP 41 n=1 Tax=Platanthera guangdongensis TaxID=2320717 RepID=A0ABR2MSI0_9ASPA
MELRVREDTPMSHDITRRIPAIAASLHDKFFHSHCSSCFRPLSSSSSSSTLQPTITNPLLSCAACSSSIHYCSQDCAAADWYRHAASGECGLFILHPHSPAGDTTDVRVALRLLHSFDRLGLLPSSPPSRDSPRRIGGLLATGFIDVMDEGGELAERIEDGAALMIQARNPRIPGACSLERASIEGEVLWAVMTNAVEVEIGELGGVGVAVYGPCFSWFNHSCSPNACYRFELSSVNKGHELRPSEVFPAGGAGEALDMVKFFFFA